MKVTKKAKQWRTTRKRKKHDNLHTNIYFILIISLSSRLSDYERWQVEKEEKERQHLVDCRFMNKLKSHLRWQFNNLIRHMTTGMKI